MRVPPVEELIVLAAVIAGGMASDRILFWADAFFRYEMWEKAIDPPFLGYKPGYGPNFTPEHPKEEASE